MTQKTMPVYQAIYNDIYEKIVSGYFPDDKPLPIEKEMCETYSTSRITVQKALQMLVSKGMVVRIPGKGSFICKDHKVNNPKTRLIGLVMCNLAMSYGINILKAIEKYAAQLQCSIVFKNSFFDRERESQCIQELVALSVDGIILQPVHDEYLNEDILKLSLQNYPVVLIDRNLSGLALSFVGSDNVQTTKKVVQYLFERGHENICFMTSDPHNTSTIEERLNAFKQAYIEANKLNLSSNIFSTIQSTRSNIVDEKLEEDDIRKIQYHLTNNPQISCIFTAEYRICQLAEEALRRMGKHVPQDISLVTFDNNNEELYQSKIAYIRQDEEQIGKCALDLLNKAIVNQKPENTKLYLPTEFVPGRSIKNLNIL